MNNKLSIIIPCYNCATTVEETVASCYEQGLTDPFEIILVDDCSTDTTRQVLEKLAQKYKEVRIFFHEKNKGGGATRNTAVEKSSYDIIFCVDSDDSLLPNTLNRMLAYLHEKKCDGVMFSGAYSFTKKKEHHRVVNFNLDTTIPVSLDILFSARPWAAGEYFMYTKQSFYTAGQYPTDHGFDTQGYGFKYIARGLKAYVCPDTFMYKRQLTGAESYFERAYNSGEYSVNYYIILREHIDIFSDKVQSLILNYDIFTKNTLAENILTDLQKEYAKDPQGFFAQKIASSEKNPEFLYQQGKFKEALDSLTASRISYALKEFDTSRYTFAILHNSKTTINDYKKFVNPHQIKKHAYNLLRPTIYQRIKRKIKHIMK